jgi:hypothetical protein
LFSYETDIETIDIKALKHLSSEDMLSMYDTLAMKLKHEQERIKRIRDFAELIRMSAMSADYVMNTKICKLRDDTFAAYIDKCKSEFESGVLKLFTLTPKHEHSEESTDRPLEHIKIPITKEHISHTNSAVYTLTLNPSSKTMRVRFRFQGRHKSVVYKMDTEYREILAQSGHACEVEFMECLSTRQDWHTMCVAIKTMDGNVHVIYADDLKYPYTESRYMGKTTSEHTLTSLKLELFSHIRSIKRSFLR